MKKTKNCESGPDYRWLIVPVVQAVVRLILSALGKGGIREKRRDSPAGEDQTEQPARREENG